MQDAIKNKKENPLWHEWANDGPPGMLRYARFKSGEKKNSGLSRINANRCKTYYNNRYSRGSKWIQWVTKKAIFTKYMRTYLRYKGGQIKREDLNLLLDTSTLKLCKIEYTRMIME